MPSKSYNKYLTEFATTPGKKPIKGTRLQFKGCTTAQRHLYFNSTCIHMGMWWYLCSSIYRRLRISRAILKLSIRYTCAVILGYLSTPGIFLIQPCGSMERSNYVEYTLYIVDAVLRPR